MKIKEIKAKTCTTKSKFTDYDNRVAELKKEAGKLRKELEKK